MSTANLNADSAREFNPVDYMTAATTDIEYLSMLLVDDLPISNPTWKADIHTMKVLLRINTRQQRLINNLHTRIEALEAAARVREGDL